MGWNAVEESGGIASDEFCLRHGILRLRSAHLTACTPLRMTRDWGVLHFSAPLRLCVSYSYLMEAVA